jgi:glycosyltransferase involved in cell wall biosynthesis
METLAGVFYRALTQVAGRPDRVHFAYPNVGRARPRGLPHDFTQLLDFGWSGGDVAEQRLLAYVRAHGIGLVVGFDTPVSHRLVGALRAADVACVVSYSGAPLSTGTGAMFRMRKRLALALAGENRVDAVICESGAMAAVATRSRGCPPDMVDIVPTGADPHVFAPAADHAAASGELHATLGLAPGRRVVLFTGHAHERKGVGVLLDAAVELVDRRGRDDVRFLLCGDRADEATLWMARIDGTEAARVVHFGGYRSDVAALMRGADIGVLPTSGWDSMTLSVHQMAASGLPIVTTSIGGLPEAVVDGVTGVVCTPGSPNSLADALARLLDDPGTAAAMGRAGRARAVAEYSLEAQERRLAEALTRRTVQALRKRGTR